MASIKDLVAQLTLLPVTVLNSHMHFDHTGGNFEFSEILVRADSYAIRPWHLTRAVRDGDRIDLGGRELEVLFTPGHTPDSLSLLDRKNGLLFTGETFYKGPIYLFTPETDFAAYGRSIARLAKLTPDLQLLLPSPCPRGPAGRANSPRRSGEKGPVGRSEIRGNQRPSGIFVRRFFSFGFRQVDSKDRVAIAIHISLLWLDSTALPHITTELRK